MRNPNPLFHNLLHPRWAESLTDNQEGIAENHAHFWGKDPSKALSSSSSYEGFTTGSGLDIYKSTLLPALETAEHEIILVTCFWAPSETLSLLSATLIQLSDRFLARYPSHSQSHDSSPKLLRVRLCFSSRSFFQKLFHTSSLAGHAYPPPQWVSKLGLPAPEKLRGLDLQVKSVFQLPFSVMHPKFVIIDRRRVFFPSCNVSHENWLECCISFQGPIVVPLLQFCHSFWGAGGRDDFLPKLPLSHRQEQEQQPNRQHYSSSRHPRCAKISSILLPSPHHRFALPFPFSRSAIPPSTPLNVFILHLLRTATHSITLLTPNLTSPPLLPAILSALNRNINITIITNRRMMLPEQLLTAGTITEIFIWRLLRKYRKAVHATASASASASTVAATLDEEEATTGILRSRPKLGRLRIGYFISDHGNDGKKCSGLKKSHIKCVVVDDAVLVLGSGNMDRASWFTSQELGVAVGGGWMGEFDRGAREELGEVGGEAREEVGRRAMEEISGEPTEVREEVAVVREVWKRLEERLDGRVEKYFGW